MAGERDDDAVEVQGTQRSLDEVLRDAETAVPPAPRRRRAVELEYTATSLADVLRIAESEDPDDVGFDDRIEIQGTASSLQDVIAKAGVAECESCLKPGGRVRYNKRKRLWLCSACDFDATR